jgi:hypothetical protein
MCFTAQQKKMIKKAKAGKLVLRIMANCANCSEDFEEKTMLEGDQWDGKVCQDCFMKSPEEEEMDCVMCGEYFAQGNMTEIKDDQWCCEKCYEENGCECWKCGEKIIEDIENEEVDCYTHTYYLENCDDGDCCATCMAEIVYEHKDEEKEEIKFEFAK